MSREGSIETKVTTAETTRRLTHEI